MILKSAIEKRIAELERSLQQSEAELAAYEATLQLELAREEREASQGATTPMKTDKLNHLHRVYRHLDGERESTPKLVLAAIEAAGGMGFVPKDIAHNFRSNGLVERIPQIYSALNYMVRRGRLKKRYGKYYAG